MALPAQSSLSVVMPFYRDDRWFPEAIESVLGQTRRPDEVIVVDDASGAESSRSLENLPATVRVIRLGVNGGPGNARQVGLQEATGELVAFIDSDDRWPPAFLETCEAGLAEFPKQPAVYTGIAKIFPDGTRREFTQKPSWLNCREAIVHFHAYPALGMLFRRSALLNVGGWDTRRLAVEDWTLMVRLLDHYGPIPLIQAPLPEYRVQHTAGRLNAQGIRKLRRGLNAFRANREILVRHYGPGAVRRRFAQAVRDRAAHHRGLTARCYLLAARLWGRPLDADAPSAESGETLASALEGSKTRSTDDRYGRNNA